MINEHTLKLLNKLAYGADIDSLESYLTDLKQAKILSDITKYEYNYLKLSNILKEIKPNSLFFTGKTALKEIPKDKYDKYFELSSKYSKTIYGTSDFSLNKLKTELVEAKDIIAVAILEGININCIYLNGYLYRIYAIGKYEKYIDLTKMLNDKISGYIEEFSKTEIVELRGKVVIPLKHSELIDKSLNRLGATIHCIRTDSNLDKLEIVIDDMYTDFTMLNIDNQLDKMQFMMNIDINVAPNALVRNIDKEVIGQALEELDDYFDNLEDRKYEFSGFEIRNNNSVLKDNSELNIIYNSKDSKPEEVYKSTIKSISTKYKHSENGDMVSIINILPIQCNNKLVVNSIEIDDIYDLEKYSIGIGNKVLFQVAEGKAFLIKQE